MSKLVIVQQQQDEEHEESSSASAKIISASSAYSSTFKKRAPKDAPVDAHISAAGNPTSCHVCGTLNRSLYRCPRCDVAYCGLKCFKGEAHAACSEDFYRGCVKDELQGKQSEQRTANLDRTTKEISVKKEEIEDETIDRGRDTDLQSLNGFSTIPNFTVLPIAPKKEPIDTSQVIPDDNHMHDQFDAVMDEENIEIASSIEEADDITQAEIETVGGMDSNKIEKGEETEENQTEKEEQIDEEAAAADILKDSSENVKVEKLRRLSRKVGKRNSDEDAEPSVKKSRSDSKEKNELDKKSDKKEISKSTPADRTEHRNYTALECPECEYRAATVMAWVSHLRSFHSTTPSMAGLLLRCACGHESYSDGHSRYCKISKITVVPHEDGTTKAPRKSVVSRMNHTELECPECEFRAMTVLSWRMHLLKSHSTTPSKAGYILRCECGNESLSEHHIKICKVSKITLIRKEDGTTRESRAS